MDLYGPLIKIETFKDLPKALHCYDYRVCQKIPVSIIADLDINWNTFQVEACVIQQV